MTNKEAIEILRSIRVYDIYPKSASEETKQAIDLAIKALEDIEEWNKLRLLCASEGIIVYKAKEDRDGEIQVL